MNKKIVRALLLTLGARAASAFAEGGKRAVSTPAAPAAIGPYSQAIASGGNLFLSGQIPVNPETGLLVEGDAAAQAAQSLKNIRAVLASEGLGMDDIVKTTVFMTDLGQFSALNEVYASFFSEPYPARSCVEVSHLPKGAKVEIEAICRAPKGNGPQSR